MKKISEAALHFGLFVALAAGCSTPLRHSRAQPIEVSLGRAPRVQLPPLTDGVPPQTWEKYFYSGLGFDPNNKTYYFGYRGSLWSAPEGATAAVRIPIEGEQSPWIQNPYVCMPIGQGRLLVCTGFTKKDPDGLELVGEHLLLVNTLSGAARRLYEGTDLRRNKLSPWFRRLLWQLIDFDKEHEAAIIWDREQKLLFLIHLDGVITKSPIEIPSGSSPGQTGDIAYSVRWRRLAYTQIRNAAEGEGATFVANDDGTGERLVEGLTGFGRLDFASSDLILESSGDLVMVNLVSGKASRIPGFGVRSICDGVVLVSKSVDPSAYRWLDRSPPDTYRLSVADLRTLPSAGVK